METIDTLSNAAEEAAEKIAGATGRAAETLSEKSEEIAEVVSEKGRQLMAMEDRFLKNCRDYIQENPMAALGIALATGFALSQILSVGGHHEHRRA